MSQPFMHSFSELADFTKMKALMERVAPNARTFYVTAINQNNGTEAQTKDVQAHCRRFGYNIKRWTARKGQLCAVVSK